MSDEVPVEWQHFVIADPDFVRFVYREEPITDRHSVVVSFPVETAAEVHPTKDQVDDGQVAIGHLRRADDQDLSSNLEEDVCMYQSVNRDGQYSDGVRDYPQDDETHAGLAMSFNSESDMDMSDRDDGQSDYSDDGSLYEYPVKGVVDNRNESPSIGDHFDEPQYYEDLEGSSNDGLQDAVLVPRAKVTKNHLSRVRSGRVTKSGKSSSTKSRVRSGSVERLVPSDHALPDPEGLDSESPVRCPVEGCNWVHGMKGGKKSPQGSLCHHIKYFAFRVSTDPKNVAVDKAHRKVHDERKEASSKSHHLHLVHWP
jgi:hypothetical protein